MCLGVLEFTRCVALQNLGLKQLEAYNCVLTGGNLNAIIVHFSVLLGLLLRLIYPEQGLLFGFRVKDSLGPSFERQY